MTTTKKQWIAYCLEYAIQPGFYSGARKVVRPITCRFDTIDDTLQLDDIGFRPAKLKQLSRNYVHEESRAAAVELWGMRKSRESYGSVGFHCFSHYIKGVNQNYWEWMRAKKEGKQLTSKNASVMGPCIQSVSVTLLPGGEVTVDLFYRTTEFFKKFPADLIFIRDILLEPFGLSAISHYTFHFANVTCHPMYFVTLLPLLDDPIYTLKKLEKRDPLFHKHLVKWTAKYLCPEHMKGIVNFQQAMRTQRDALRRLDESSLSIIQRYLRDKICTY